VQDLLLDRLVWFLRNVDLTQGLETIVAHYREGIAQVEASLDGALSKPALAARAARVALLTKAGVPEALARRVASLAVLKAAPDIVLVADRANKPVDEVTATYFATEAFFQLDRVADAVPSIVVSDYFDRLALDRALDSIGDAERRLTAALVGHGHAGVGAVEEWVRPGRRKSSASVRPFTKLQAQAHIVEIVGGGEPAGRFSAGVTASCPGCGAARSHKRFTRVFDALWRSDAPLIRGPPQVVTVWSAAHHFVLRCARDTSQPPNA
jgi:NAD-specific glutamate dehydrogenase